MCRLSGTVVPTNSEPEPVETVQYHQQRVSTPTKQVGCFFFNIVSTSTKQVDYFFFVSCVPLSVHCASIILYKFYQRASMPLLLLCAIPFCLLCFSSSVCPTGFCPFPSDPILSKCNYTYNWIKFALEVKCNSWHSSPSATFLPISLLLGHWYEIMALYYVKSILTEISASRQDGRVLQKASSSESNFWANGACYRHLNTSSILEI